MSNFRTEFKIQPSNFNISHTHSLLFIGSCFTENIGFKLNRLKFNACINPFGILFNPDSIYYSISRLLSGEKYTMDEISEKNGIWHSFDYHSDFSSTNKIECLNKINEAFKLGKERICDADILFITFGSAHLYQLKESQKLVSNCHKYPSSAFDKKIFDFDKTFESYKILFDHLKQINPKLRIVLTVSPVRYLSDGFVENQISKSMLILLCSKLQLAFQNVLYFPAYEIMMDDLRDYRFYSEDMIHPNEQAVNYIFDIFQKTYFDESTQELSDEIDKIVKTSEHRVFFEDSLGHKKLCETMIKRIEKLKKDFSILNFDKEIRYFEK